MSGVPGVRQLARMLAVAWILLGGTGCATPSSTTGKGAHSGNTPVEPLNKPGGVTQVGRVRAVLRPLGAIPYDNHTLALTSPDMHHIATETGAGPTWPTVLAERDSTVPAATHLEIYTLDMRDGIKETERQPPVLAATVQENALLGRSCDDEGFLVESPRDDGSRWIGKASWQTGAVTWLVQDDRVNAFATLGPSGRLAWSRREQLNDHFDLVVRDAAGEWTLPAAENDLVMPCWSDSGDYLFVFHLAGRNLELQFGLASSAQAFTQSAVRLPLMENGSIYMAYRAVTGNPSMLGGRAPSSDQLMFFHPDLNRCFLWRPLAPLDRSRTALMQGSFAALMDDANTAFVGTWKELLRQSLVRPNEHVSVLAGANVPRPSTLANWPYVVLKPAEGRIGITAMRLLPVDDASAGVPRK